MSDQLKKRLKKESPGTQSPITETLSQLSQLTQPEEDSDEMFDGTQMTQCSPVKGRTESSPRKSSSPVLLAEESPEAGLALALKGPRGGKKCTRAKSCTPATGQLIFLRAHEQIRVIVSNRGSLVGVFFAELPKLQLGTWTRWPVGGTPPIGRWGATSVYTEDDRLIVYGGERDIRALMAPP